MAKLPDSKMIKELADLLSETGLTEIEVETGDTRIRVVRESHPVSVYASAPVTTSVAAPVGTAPEAAAAAAAPEAAANLSDHPGIVKSPMVGTAYLAPEPGTADFVKVGDMVNEGQTLLIIEAMKTMNPIASPRTGKVTQIIVTNEQPVEFDEALLIIE